MAILVTGGAGYIGSVTVDYLFARGEKVVVLDNLVRGHRQTLDAEVPFYQGDVGDHTLLAQIAQVGVRRFVFSSSCATYGEPEALPIKEDSRQWPTSPYGWSKLFLERVLSSYDTAYGLEFLVLRYFNAAGAIERRGEDHDPETHLANALQVASAKSGELSVFGNTYATPDGTAIRDYIHVSDLADAHGRAVEYLRQGRSEFLNLGGGRGYSVLEVIECARQVTGKPFRSGWSRPALAMLLR